MEATVRKNIEQSESCIKMLPKASDSQYYYVSNNKKKGVKSEVYAFEIQDLKNLLQYFQDKEMWLQYLALILSCNLARRASDILALKWSNFYDPKNGKLRSEINIVEKKTDKLANPYINSAIKSAFDLYISKTGCDITANNYENPIFLKLGGTHFGTVITESGWLKSLKKAGNAVGITYNIGTHSPRKTFGKFTRMLHPNDYDSMQLLQTIYNHSSEAVTKNYIGLTKEKVNKYYSDMGEFFDSYITGNAEFDDKSDSPMTTLNSNDLRDIVKMAFESGMNVDKSDPMAVASAISEIYSRIEELKK